MGYRGNTNFPWQGTKGRDILMSIRQGVVSVDEAVEMIQAAGWGMTRRKVLRALDTYRNRLDPAARADADAMAESIRKRMERMDANERDIREIVSIIRERLQVPTVPRPEPIEPR